MKGQKVPKADFFARLGLFVIKNFFDAQSCERFYLEARLASKHQATVVNKSGKRVAEDFRKTKQAEVSATTVAVVRERLLAVQPRLESHFDVTLSGCQGPEFLVYKVGDFFRAHRDSTDDPDYPDDVQYVQKRQVSVIVFLNNEAEEPELASYGGGSLILYGIIDDPREKTRGFPLVGEAGLLIACHSDLFHEVTPVTDGERYTIVCWFF